MRPRRGGGVNEEGHIWGSLIAANGEFIRLASKAEWRRAAVARLHGALVGTWSDAGRSVTVVDGPPMTVTRAEIAMLGLAFLGLTVTADGEGKISAAPGAAPYGGDVDRARMCLRALEGDGASWYTAATFVIEMRIEAVARQAEITERTGR